MEVLLTSSIGAGGEHILRAREGPQRLPPFDEPHRGIDKRFRGAPALLSRRFLRISLAPHARGRHFTRRCVFARFLRLQSFGEEDQGGRLIASNDVGKHPCQVGRQRQRRRLRLVDLNERREESRCRCASAGRVPRASSCVADSSSFSPRATKDSSVRTHWTPRATPARPLFVGGTYITSENPRMRFDEATPAKSALTFVHNAPAGIINGAESRFGGRFSGG